MVRNGFLGELDLQLDLAGLAGFSLTERRK